MFVGSFSGRRRLSLKPPAMRWSDTFCFPCTCGRLSPFPCSFKCILPVDLSSPGGYFLGSSCSAQCFTSFLLSGGAMIMTYTTLPCFFPFLPFLDFLRSGFLVRLVAVIVFLLLPISPHTSSQSQAGMSAHKQYPWRTLGSWSQEKQYCQSKKLQSQCILQKNIAMCRLSSLRSERLRAGNRW